MWETSDIYGVSFETNPQEVVEGGHGDFKAELCCEGWCGAEKPATSLSSTRLQCPCGTHGLAPAQYTQTGQEWGRIQEVGLLRIF